MFCSGSGKNSRCNTEGRVGTIFTPFKLHAIFGLALIVIGFIFDFGLIITMENFSASLQKSVTQLAWTKHVYSRWIIFGLMALGALFFVIGGIWESQGPPAYEWIPACTVLTIGLAGVLLGIVLEAYNCSVGELK